MGARRRRIGLRAAASPLLCHLTEGVEKADSWATDGHKWLNVPYDSGIALVRDPHPLKAAMAITAEYLPTSAPHRNPSDFTPELSRRARGVEVWAALRHLGRRGVADMIERCCRHARRFADGFRSSGYRVLNDVVLNQVLVSFDEAEKTKRVIAGIQQDGTCYCGGTVWQGQGGDADQCFILGNNRRGCGEKFDGDAQDCRQYRVNLSFQFGDWESGDESGLGYAKRSWTIWFRRRKWCYRDQTARG